MYLALSALLATNIFCKGTPLFCLTPGGGTFSGAPPGGWRKTCWSSSAPSHPPARLKPDWCRFRTGCLVGEVRAEAEGVPPRDSENSDTGPSYIPRGTALRTASWGQQRQHTKPWLTSAGHESTQTLCCCLVFKQEALNRRLNVLCFAPQGGEETLNIYTV